MRKCVATVGTFDGVHVGHEAILDKVAELAKEKDLLSRVITFENHPLTVINPDKAPKWAIQRHQTENLLESYVDKVSLINFTKELSAMTAREFMRLIRSRYNVDTLVMGYDNTFGSDRLQSPLDYEAAGREEGINIVYVDPVIIDDKPASSSRLRKAIEIWDFPTVAQLVGAPLYEGIVERGKQLGRKIGVPTMNIALPDDIIHIPDGVYAAMTYLDDYDDGSPSVLSVGSNPTVGGKAKTFELHVIGKKLGNLYGMPICFSVFEKIRDIKKFDSVMELKEAIKEDIRTAKRLFMNNIP